MDAYMQTLQADVSAGARFLDGIVPDWADRITLNKLDMVSIDQCVLGQVFQPHWYHVFTLPFNQFHRCSGYGWGIYKYRPAMEAAGVNINIFASELAHQFWCQEVLVRRFPVGVLAA